MSSAGRDIRKIAIADGIYQFMTMRDAYVRQLNSVVIVNDNDVLVFDTDTRPSSARIILAEIRKITDKPVRYVVNSHHHPVTFGIWKGRGTAVKRRQPERAVHGPHHNLAAIGGDIIVNCLKAARQRLGAAGFEVSNAKFPRVSVGSASVGRLLDNQIAQLFSVCCELWGSAVAFQRNLSFAPGLFR
jgi:hypothetical protein